MLERSTSDRIEDPEIAHAEGIYVQSEAEDAAYRTKEMLRAKFAERAVSEPAKPESYHYQRAAESLDIIAKVSGNTRKEHIVESYGARHELEIIQHRVVNELSEARKRLELSVPSEVVGMFDVLVQEYQEGAEHAQDALPSSVAPQVFALDCVRGDTHLLTILYDERENPDVLHEIDRYIDTLIEQYTVLADAVALYVRSR